MGFDVLGLDVFHLVKDVEGSQTGFLFVFWDETSASRDQFAGDDIFFQTVEVIAFRLDGGVGKNTGGFLEGSRRKEGFGVQSCLGDALNHWAGNRWTEAIEEGFRIGLGVTVDIHFGAWQ